MFHTAMVASSASEGARGASSIEGFYVQAHGVYLQIQQDLTSVALVKLLSLRGT